MVQKVKVNWEAQVRRSDTGSCLRLLDGQYMLSALLSRQLICVKITRGNYQENNAGEDEVSIYLGFRIMGNNCVAGGGAPTRADITVSEGKITCHRHFQDEEACDIVTMALMLLIRIILIRW